MENWPGLVAEVWEDFGPLAGIALVAVVLAVLGGKWFCREESP